LANKNVVIYSSHSLFREGLKRVLAEVESLSLIGLAETVEEVLEIMGDTMADYIIVEQIINESGQSADITRLLEIPNVRVLTVSSDDAEIQIYRRDQVGEATAEKLIAALTEEDN